MTTSPAEQAAMRRALELAGARGLPLGPNPRVGCVLLDDSGTLIAEGFHRGAGTPHAEVDALTNAGERAAGATAVVTLEPCAHVGRTGPCTQALIAAGVRRVVFSQRDPDPAGAGGAGVLRAAGIDVEGGVLIPAVAPLNRAWTFGVQRGRPMVTWKFAATLDGRSAAADGTSRWISGQEARLDTHRLRADCDVMVVGTGTVLGDNPRLTVRDSHDNDLPHQPTRAVMGLREVPHDAAVRAGVGDLLHLDTRDPAEALDRLFSAGKRHVWLEGGPTLAAAFLRAGLVDEVIAYVAPSFLGAGASAIGDLGITTVTDQLRWHLRQASVVGKGADATVRLTLDRPMTPREER